MWVRVAARAVQKAGNAVDEYEDACFPAHSYLTEARVFRAAVADGATETSYSGIWARELVSAYCRRRLDPDLLDESLPRIQRRWQARVGDRPLPWYAEEKLRQGAFSTLAGVTIRASAIDVQSPSAAGALEPSQARDVTAGPNGCWSAVAAGDSCLFQLRRGKFVRSFPILNAAEFSNHPALLSSLPSGNFQVAAMVKQTGGTWESGDVFLLTTDALANWLMRGPGGPQEDEPLGGEIGPVPAQNIRQQDSSERTSTRARRGAIGLGRRNAAAGAVLPLSRSAVSVSQPNRTAELLTKLENSDQFDAWLSDLRESGNIRNDDVTAVAVQVWEEHP